MKLGVKVGWPKMNKQLLFPRVPMDRTHFPDGERKDCGVKQLNSFKVKLKLSVKGRMFPGMKFLLLNHFNFKCFMPKFKI